jgi:hypothetical protein
LRINSFGAHRAPLQREKTGFHTNSKGEDDTQKQQCVSIIAALSLGGQGGSVADGWVTGEGLRLAQWGERCHVPAQSGRQAPRLSAIQTLLAFFTRARSLIGWRAFADITRCCTCAVACKSGRSTRRTGQSASRHAELSFAPAGEGKPVIEYMTPEGKRRPVDIAARRADGYLHLQIPVGVPPIELACFRLTKA